nr:hypothetical protein [Tanacetum cinerariifolium]
MPGLEDIIYSNDEDVVGAEADFNNLESSILVSPIPTARIHKDHPVSQIIGDLSSTTQTRSMPYGKRAIGTKWVYRNKKDEREIVIKNKERLVAQGHTLEEGINYKESAFLYGTIEQEVYVCQPLGFEDHDHPDKVYKVVKALYGLHQAPRAWYEALATYLLENADERLVSDEFHGGTHIILGSSGKSASTPIDKEKPLLKDPDVKRIFRYLKGKPHLGLWYLNDSPFDLVAYSDSDYAEAEYVAAASCCAQVLWIQNQLLDYSYIKYALTINPYIYVPCIKQFWNTVTVKQSNDVTMLQALVDRKKVVLTETVIRDVLRLDDAKGVDCQPNEEIFAELARMGYEKPSKKLTFYKAFFSSQWKFLIHTILQSMSAKCTSWNEFSPTMASANQLGDFSSHTTKYISPALTQKVFANIRRVRKGFSGVETPLFAGMLVIGENVEASIAAEQVQDDAAVAAAQEGVTSAIEEDVQEQSIPSPTPPPHPPQDLPSNSSVQPTPPPSPQPQPQAADFLFGLIQTTLDTCDAVSSRIEQLEELILQMILLWRMTNELERDEGVALTAKKEEEKKTDEAKNSAGDDQVKGRQAEIYQIDMDHPSKVLSMQEDEPAEVEEVVEVVTTAKLITKFVAVASKSVSAASITIPAAEPQVPAATPTVVLVRVVAASTRRGKRVIIRDPEEESTVKTPAETKSKEKGKGIMVEEPKPIKKKQQIEGEERRSIESINETPAQKAAKRRKLNEEVAELNKHLEIVPDEDDDVFTEATPLARKLPVVDYSIILLNNKPHYKIVKADGTHQLYISFLTLLKNFDRDDLESLWSIVKERLSTTKPDNFTDDFLLTTLRTMFEEAYD